MSRLYWTKKQEIGPPARFGHAMAYDSNRGRTVLFGGFVGPIAPGSGSSFNDTWEWDGENWSQMADSGPGSRYWHSMAFDSHRSQTVLFGGWPSPLGAALADTWAWDGENWTQLADSGPPLRILHGLAYDSARGVTVLFGGLGAFNFLADTWEWNGTSWTQKAVVGPSARDSMPLAFDGTRGRTVLFGGSGDWNFQRGSAMGDTWEWDGTAWAKIANFGAPASMLATLAFNGDSVALLGGVASIELAEKAPTVLAATWSWDGRHWTIRQTFSPSPRWQHAMSYDSKRSCLVIFGGLGNSPLSGGSALGDTWESSETP
jgi:hypothetical protein